MAAIYLDTSALVKLYLREEGTERMRSLVSGPNPPSLVLLALARAELHSALRRRQRLGDIDGEETATVIARFESHLRTRFLHQPVNDVVVDTACHLLARHPLRAYDALQLAGCVVFSGASPDRVAFACADKRLLEAAEKEQVAGLDPTEA